MSTAEGTDFQSYSQEHALDALFDKMRKSLETQRPERPLSFLSQQLQQESQKSSECRRVIFVLGGPGSGKGTQCSKLVTAFKNVVHFSAGDLLREETKSESETGKMIAQMIREGAIVPGHITIELLRKAIYNHPNSKTATFLIDGFPREMKQALDFEREVSPCQFVLFFDCPMEELEKRLLNRGLTSGRSDDNIESIRKRFITFEKQSMPVIEYFKAQDRVKKINTCRSIDEIFDEVSKLVVPNN
jgi:UMP-CMP kinase family protein